MSVIRFPRAVEENVTPLVVFVDLQQEYVSDGRAHALACREPWWTNAQRLLTFARQRSLPVAHFRQLKSEPFFNRATPFADWIEEFRPRPHEMVFERSQPSCYANEAFTALLNSLTRPVFLLAGLTSESNCLSTVFDAYHRGHEATLVADACGARRLGAHSEAEVHGVVSEITSLFADVVSTTEVVAQYAGRKPSLAG